MDKKQTEIEMPPPPYSMTNSQSSQNYGQNPSPSGTPVDNLNQILGMNQQLNFYSASRIGFATSAAVVQLQDINGSPVISILYTPGPSVSTVNDTRIQLGGTTKFMDSTGRALLTGQESGRSLTVSSGDMTLGVVEGFGLFGQNIVAKNVLGEIVLKIERTSNNKEFKFLMANGTQIGKIEKNSVGLTSLSFSHHLDSHTKGLLLATSYILYLHYFAETFLGSGQIGMFKKVCCCTVITMFALPVLIMIIVFVSMS